MLSDFYMNFICVTLYVIQIFAAKYGNKIYLSKKKKKKKSFVAREIFLHVKTLRIWVNFVLAIPILLLTSPLFFLSAYMF